MHNARFNGYVSTAVPQELMKGGTRWLPGAWFQSAALAHPMHCNLQSNGNTSCCSLLNVVDGPPPWTAT